MNLVKHISYEAPSRVSIRYSNFLDENDVTIVRLDPANNTPLIVNTIRELSNALNCGGPVDSIGDIEER